MLALKPNCENCDRDLPADSPDACICSYECTFCRTCVDHVLKNVCPNCGGGFVSRPFRPKQAWRDGVSLLYQPAAGERTLKPVDALEHKAFSEKIVTLSPESR